jgi:hypothetical protein
MRDKQLIHKEESFEATLLSLALPSFLLVVQMPPVLLSAFEILVATSIVQTIQS